MSAKADESGSHASTTEFASAKESIMRRVVYFLVIGLALPVFYVLGVGPADYLFAKGIMPQEVYQALYGPLLESECAVYLNDYRWFWIILGS